MKITLKTLQQQSFKIDISEEEMVKTLKEKIEELRGKEHFPVANQKLIYAGQILNDDTPLKEYKIEEKSFIVLMVTKPKQSPPQTNTDASGPSTSNSSGNSGASPDSLKPTEQSQEDVPSSSSDGHLESPPHDPFSENPLEALGGQSLEHLITEMTRMGYEREHVVDALRSGFSNPEEAIEQLLSGIPAGEEVIIIGQEILVPVGNGNEPLPPLIFGTPTVFGPFPSTAGGPLSFLRSHPQFQRLKQLVQQDSSLLPTLLNDIGNEDPELLNLIRENEEEFYRMLSEPSVDVFSPPFLGMSSGPVVISGFDGDGPHHMSAYIQVTEEEKNAIERLKAMGFPESLVIQAYFACEKNENLAANFLVQQNLDEE